MDDLSTVVLCGRSDLYPGRFFNGLITQLSVFDTALGPNEVRRCWIPGSCDTNDMNC